MPKIKIDKIEFRSEKEGKYGMMYNFVIHFDGKTALYTAKKKEQTTFEVGKEYDVILQEIAYGNDGKTFTKIKLNKQKFNSNYGKHLQREQSKYSGFSLSYAKDLAVAGIINKEEILTYSTSFFKHMVDLDKTQQ